VGWRRFPEYLRVVVAASLPGSPGQPFQTAYPPQGRCCAAYRSAHRVSILLPTVPPHGFLPRVAADPTPPMLQTSSGVASTRAPPSPLSRIVHLQCWCLLQFQVEEQVCFPLARSGLKHAIWRSLSLFVDRRRFFSCPSAPAACGTVTPLLGRVLEFVAPRLCCWWQKNSRRGAAVADAVQALFRGCSGLFTDGAPGHGAEPYEQARRLRCSAVASAVAAELR